MQATNGKLIAKTGAEGLCVVINLEKNQALIVKISDSNMQARSLVVIESLLKLGWISDAEIKTGVLSELFNLKIKTHNAETVGEINLFINIKP
ncbi:MAG: asparaginase [Ignavibacteriales bacterium]|nr:asparaginase [Ignavibacteriales bacterium]